MLSLSNISVSIAFQTTPELTDLIKRLLISDSSVACVPNSVCSKQFAGLLCVPALVCDSKPSQLRLYCLSSVSVISCATVCLPLIS